MRFMSILAVASLSAVPAMAAGTDPVVVYPYASSANYCPSGLQPVSVDGTVSCGTPTTDVTYQQATSAPRGRRSDRSWSKNCPIGNKGC